MRYFLTGHTGFKGAWLALWLTRRGHEVHGLALDPEPDSLFLAANVAELLASDYRQDVRDSSAVAGALADVRPDVVVHLAAQPLVGESYRNPRATVDTNVIGTLNLLEAVTNVSSVKAHLVVTTDKVYRNVGRAAGYREEDPLGGDDPYSASKAMADVLTHAWTTSFGGPATAIARAGNVIGGGDHSTERLIPDLVRAWSRGDTAILRHPNAVRPWQHVLDCLNGYVTLIDAIIAKSELGTADAWNFGPDHESLVSVEQVVATAAGTWGGVPTWQCSTLELFHESSILALNSDKAHSQLGWHNHLGLDEAVNWTVDWYRSVRDGQPALQATTDQLDRFFDLLDATPN